MKSKSIASRIRPLILAVCLSPLATIQAGAQVEGVGVQRHGLVVGNDDRQLVDEAWLNAHPRYRAVVDAVGLFQWAGRGTCTATYVGGGLAVTAGHCIPGNGAYERHNLTCDPVTIRWGVRTDRASYLTSRCRRVLAAKESAPYDYAILEIDPLPRSEIPAFHNAGSSRRVGSPGTMFSHPGGRALTWSSLCYLPPYASAIAHECDSEPGSSGALILEDGSLHAVGIHYGHSGALNSGIYVAHTPLGDIMNYRFTAAGRIVANSGRCLDVTNSKSDDRTPVQLWDCSGADAQKWSRTPYDTLVGLAGKCLDAPYETNGTRPWIFGCHYQANQKWSFTNTEVRGASDKCLDVPGLNPPNSTRAQVWACHGGDGQKWTLTVRNEIRNRQGKCLDAASFDPGNGTPVVVYDCHGGANQMWTIRDGHISGIGGLCLDITGGKTANGSPLQLYECTASSVQQWNMAGAITGPGGKCLEAAGQANGQAVVINACRGDSSQSWRYFP